MARLNMCHNTREWHRDVIRKIKWLNEKEISVMIDIEGQIREMEQGLNRLIVFGSGRWSDLNERLQDILEGVNEANILPEKFDSALTSSGSVTIYNENSSSSGNYASCLFPVAALAAGYCNMWWGGWSFSDVMYVTRHNMANVVEALIRKVANKSNDFARNRITNTMKRMSEECTMGTYLDLVCFLEGQLENNFGALVTDLLADFSLFFTYNLDFRPLWDPGDATAKIVKIVLWYNGIEVLKL
ncbi:hypothetical protein EV1_022708 [Malus domestica]